MSVVDIIPGIFENEWRELERKVALVVPYVEWVQIDVSDGTFVPAKTVVKFDQLDKSLSFEAHLMVADPVKYIRPLVEAGFKRIIAHIECQDPRLFLENAKYESVEVGLAVDGMTELEQVEPFLEEIDVVLVMTAEAGESGRTFLPDTVEKIKRIAESFPDLTIEVEGGIDDQTVKIVKAAGATRIVSTKYIFDHEADMATAVNRLKNI